MSNLTSTIQAVYLAYDAGDIGVRPILADALEDVGNYEEAEWVRDCNMHMRSGATLFVVYSKRRKNGQTRYTCCGCFFVFSTSSADVKIGLQSWLIRQGCTPTATRGLIAVEGQGTFPAITPKNPLPS